MYACMFLWPLLFLATTAFDITSTSLAVAVYTYLNSVRCCSPLLVSDLKTKMIFGDFKCFSYIIYINFSCRSK